MKKINILLTMIMLLAFMACDDDDYVAPNSFSDVAWYSPAYARQGAEYMPVIGKGDYFSIADISQGAIEHKWELLNPEIYFLKGDLVRNDTMLVEKISGGGEVGDITTDETVHLYFPEGGIQGVRLYNTFEEEVFFKGKDSTISSVYDEKLGLHVFDYTFNVDVYHDVVAAYKVYRANGDSIDFTAADTISIDLANGEMLSFAQNVDSIYHITDVTWNIPGGVPSTSSEDSLSVTFYSPGTYQNISLTANRSGNNIPSSNDRVIIPLKVTVASGAFAMVDITKVSSTAVRVQLSGPSRDPLSASDFEILVKNADLGEEYPFDVAAVEMVDDNTAAILTLADLIYSNDEVHVEYVGNGKAVDGRPLEKGTIVLDPITDLSVVDMDFFAFETGTSGWVNSNTNPGSLEFPADPDPSRSGTSAKLSAASGGGVFMDCGSVIPLQEGTTYSVSYSVFMPVGGRSLLNNGFNFKIAPDGEAFNGEGAMSTGTWITFGNTSHFTEGEWVRHTDEITPTVTTDYWMQLRFGSGGTGTTEGVFYVDDINVEVVDIRPGS